MSNIMDMISQHIGSGEIEQIAARLGVSKEQAESAVGMALPTLLGAAARKADNDDDAAALHQQVQQHDGSIFDQLGDFLGGSNPSASSGVQAFGGAGDLLGILLGGRQGRVEQGIGKASGMNSGQVGSLLGMLAPLVMGALAKRSKSENMDQGGLSDMLRGEKKSMENQASGGLLAGLLDQDGDGDFDFKDVLSLGMSRLFGRRS